MESIHNKDKYQTELLVEFWLGQYLCPKLCALLLLVANNNVCLDDLQSFVG